MDSCPMQPFAFAASLLDRAAHKRDDPEFIVAAMNDPATGVVVFCEGQCLISEPDRWRLHYLSPAELAARGIEIWPPVFLGFDEGRPLFAVSIEEPQRNMLADGHFVDLWRNAGRLSDQEAATVAYAKGMLEWHARHRFCGRSGVANRIARGGHQLLGDDGHGQFPRVDPAIIVLVHRDDHCLLGRQASWPERHYATIAGFVEPGESLEDAVRREVKEETDVDVGAVQYLASQPWPFPSSLMVGFHAEADSAHIVLNDKELSDARWFSREQLAAGHVRLPPAVSIAFFLIEQWFDRAGGQGLRELTARDRWA